MGGHIVPSETTGSFCRCVREIGGICWDLLVQGIVALPLCHVMSATKDCQSCVFFCLELQCHGCRATGAF